MITQVPSNGLGRLGPKRGCLGHTAATGPHITFLKRNELFFIVKMALFSSISRHDLRNTILNKVPIENSEKRGFLGPIQSNGTGIVRAGHHAPLEIQPKHESSCLTPNKAPHRPQRAKTRFENIFSTKFQLENLNKPTINADPTRERVARTGPRPRLGRTNDICGQLRKPTRAN